MNSLATFPSGPNWPASGPPLARRRTWSFWLVALLVGTVMVRDTLAAAATPAVTKEYQVKAAFLYNFTKFVAWPAERFKDASSPIIIGVLGSNPFGAELENIVRDRKVNGRSITIVHLQTADDALPVHAMFIPMGKEGLIEKQIGPLISAGVLAVGESERFFALGGTVTFTTTDDKVRFEINMVAAEHGGLKISAQLQKLCVPGRRKS